MPVFYVYSCRQHLTTFPGGCWLVIPWEMMFTKKHQQSEGIDVGVSARVNKKPQKP